MPGGRSNSGLSAAAFGLVAVRESIGWSELTHELAAEFVNGELLLAHRSDGKVYTGRVVEVTHYEVTLASGNQRQVLQYRNYRYHVARYKGPTPKPPRLADKRLPI